MDNYKSERRESGLRLEREIRTIRAMVDLFCRKRHGAVGCPECESLLGYAEERIRKCPFGNSKPACSRCSVHCYKSGMRSKIKEIMRFAGPRMIYRHPVLAFLHFKDTLRSSEGKASG